jgi:hypothetical protein
MKLPFHSGTCAEYLIVLCLGLELTVVPIREMHTGSLVLFKGDICLQIKRTLAKEKLLQFRAFIEKSNFKQHCFVANNYCHLFKMLAQNNFSEHVVLCIRRQCVLRNFAFGASWSSRIQPPSHSRVRLGFGSSLFPPNQPNLRKLIP